MKLDPRVKKILRPFVNFYRINFQEQSFIKRINAIVSKQESFPVDKKKKLIFNSQYATTFTWIEFLLANKMKKRGYDSEFLVCDGLPYCEQESVTFKRPSCESCTKRIQDQISAFNYKPHKLSDFLTEEDRAEAKEIAMSKSLEALRSYKKFGVDLGEISFRNLAHYMKGSYPLEGVAGEHYRRIFESGYLILLATNKYYTKIDDATVITTNGKFIQSGISVDLGKEKNYDHVTWEVFNQFTSTVFARNSIALEQRIDEAWEQEKDKELTEEQKGKLYQNFKQQSTSGNTPFKYQESSYEKSHDEIVRKYHLDKNKPIVVMFTNVEWDSTAMMDSGFDSMLDWIQSMIDYCSTNTDFQLIVRAHPGELKVPDDLKTRYPICDRVLNTNKNLPQNVRLIGPLEQVNSYALGELADVTMVYSSTIGIEFALRGIKAWVGSHTYYSRKGFSLDIENREDMHQKLDEKLFKLRLSDSERLYAERFAYMVRYRYLFSVPFIANGRFSREAFEACLKGEAGQNEFENICDLIEGKRLHIDLGTAHW